MIKQALFIGLTVVFTTAAWAGDTFWGNIRHGGSTEMGSYTYYRDGTSAVRIGDYTYYSDGTYEVTISATTFRSDGHISRTVGDYTYRSDGNNGYTIGNTHYYNGGSITEMGEYRHIN